MLRATLAALVVVCTALISAVPAAAAPASAGDVRFVKDGGAGFDAVTASPSGSTKAFFQRNYARMVVHSPYFDSRLRWYRRAWAYLDLYGISTRSSIARQRPKWILRDSVGNPLYIPFDCSAGSCVQYAGDPTNPAFRRWWIRRARRIVRRGYKGVYLDNVNLIRRVSYGTGQETVPYSPRRRRRISGVAWRRAIAKFTRQIRRSLRRTEIAHNVIWFAPGAKGKWGRMQTRSANVITLERGVNDAGLTGGKGKFSLRNFLRFSDWVHRRRAGVLHWESANTQSRRNYGLAGYFMVNNGRDFIASEGASNPTDWWRGYEVRLGAPRGKRYRWRGVLRRDFQRGMVLMNEPGSPTRGISLPRTLESADRQYRVSTVALGPADGAVLVNPR
jgi:Hypothetical glycosyl hydrolase family 15